MVILSLTVAFASAENFDGDNDADDGDADDEDDDVGSTVFSTGTMKKAKIATRLHIEPRTISEPDQCHLLICLERDSCEKQNEKEPQLEAILVIRS